MCEAKAAVQKKKWAEFYMYLICCGVAFGVTALKVMCYGCSLCKVIGNQGFFSHSRYNLLGIAAVFQETSAYFLHY